MRLYVSIPQKDSSSGRKVIEIDGEPMTYSVAYKVEVEKQLGTTLTVDNISYQDDKISRDIKSLLHFDL